VTRRTGASVVDAVASATAFVVPEAQMPADGAR
jgi:hypothetical protein